MSKDARRRARESGADAQHAADGRNAPQLSTARMNGPAARRIGVPNRDRLDAWVKHASAVHSRKFRGLLSTAEGEVTPLALTFGVTLRATFRMGAALQRNFLATVTFLVRRKGQERGGVDPAGGRRPRARAISSAFSA